MARRLLALFAAVGMVAVALGGKEQPRQRRCATSTGSGPLQLVCATELAAICDGLAAPDIVVTVEPVAVTADRLRAVDAEDADIDGWLTPGPWGAVVDSTRTSSAGSLSATPANRSRARRSCSRLGRTSAPRSRARTGDLGCVGDAVTTRGFRLGVAPDDQAIGLLSDAALGAGHAKNPDFATNDLEETDLADWLTGVDVQTDRVSRNPGGRSFSEMLTTRGAGADGYLSTEADIGPQFARAGDASAARPPVRGARRHLRTYCSPCVPANAAIASASIVRSDRVRQLLQASGWHVEGLPAADGVRARRGCPTTRTDYPRQACGKR